MLIFLPSISAFLLPSLIVANPVFLFVMSTQIFTTLKMKKTLYLEKKN